MLIRPALSTDLPQILAIYNDIITSSTAVYTDVPVSLENCQTWYQARRDRGYPVLFAVAGDVLLGYASFADFRVLPGFRHTVEHTIHLAADARGQGTGSRLLSALIAEAKKINKHVMVAAIDTSNDASIRFHLRHGFKEVGRMPEVGYKFGHWLDLMLLQRMLSQDLPESATDKP